MRRVLDWLARNWRLKLAAVGVSLLLWSVVKAEETVSVFVRDVPVAVSLRDPAWVSTHTPVPARVTLQLTGPVREILRAEFQRPRILVPVEDVSDSVFVSGLRAEWVHMPVDLPHTRVDDILPATVRLAFHRIRPEPTPPTAMPPSEPAAAPAAVTPVPGTTASPVPAPPPTPPESAAAPRRATESTTQPHRASESPAPPRHAPGKAPRDTTTTRR